MVDLLMNFFNLNILEVCYFVLKKYGCGFVLDESKETENVNIRSIYYYVLFSSLNSRILFQRCIKTLKMELTRGSENFV